MILRPDYSKATNAAYEVLSRRSSLSLSTNVFSIIEEDLRETCRLLTYGQAVFLYGASLECLKAESEYGFSIVDGKTGRRVILYNEEMPVGAIRFTLAHEIGHAVLGHEDEEDPNAEKEANCFARNLLCPIPVVIELDAKTLSDYVLLFDITERMARVAVDKRGTDRYYIRDNLYATISFMLEASMMGFDGVEEYSRFLAS